MKGNWECENIMVYHFKEKEGIPFLLSAAKRFVTNMMKVPEKAPGGKIEEFKKETEGSLAYSFMLEGTRRYFVVDTKTPERYKDLATPTMEIIVRMLFVPKEVTPYELDEVFKALYDVDKTSTLGQEYLCEKCKTSFQTMKEFVSHIKESGHDDEIRKWFPYFFEERCLPC